MPLFYDPHHPPVRLDRDAAGDRVRGDRELRALAARLSAIPGGSQRGCGDPAGPLGALHGWQARLGEFGRMSDARRWRRDTRELQGLRDVYRPSGLLLRA
jgi:hypothetical protein